MNYPFAKDKWVVHAWNKAEAYELQKQKAEFFEQEYNKLSQSISLKIKNKNNGNT